MAEEAQTPEQDRAMYADPRMSSTFTALFHVCPILFVGYGLVDDDFDQLLARVRVLAGPQPPRHFALVPAERVTRSWRRRVEGAGVRLIPYANPDGKHGEVARLLRLLGEGRAAVTTTAETPPAVRTLEDVRQVLQDVGLQDRTQASMGSLFPFPRSEVAQLSRRLLEIEGWNCTTIGVADMLEYNPMDTLIFGAVLGVREGQAFVVAFEAEASLFRPSSRLPKLAEQLEARGGALCTYTLSAMPSPATCIEVIDLRGAAVRHVSEVLRVHAQRYLATWTNEDEQRFVAARARRADDHIMPVAEAMDEALAHARLVLVLGDFGTGKSTQLRRRAAQRSPATNSSKHSSRDCRARPCSRSRSSIAPRWKSSFARPRQPRPRPRCARSPRSMTSVNWRSGRHSSTSSYATMSGSMPRAASP